MAITRTSIKRGATFSLPLLVALPAGAWSATCNIRKIDDTLVGSPAVTLVPLGTPDADGNTHSGLVEATSVETASWALGTWCADIRFADTSVPPVVIFSDQFCVAVAKANTHD